MYEVLTVAGGVLLVFYALRAIDWVLSASERAAKKRTDRELHSFMKDMTADLIKHLEEAEAAKPAMKKPARRKPTTATMKSK